MAQFQILIPYAGAEWRPVTTEFVYAPNGDQQYLWSTFEEAEAARQTLLLRAPGAQMRIALAGADIGDLDWQTREKLRFADSSYTPTPWHNEPWYQAKHEEHFCHVSTEQAGKIAFTENAAKAQADRQLVMSPGRYLHRYFSDHLDNNAIEGWCAKLSVQLQEHALKITQDADEIEDVYVGGPCSCMSHSADDFDSCCHPARVYAGPDTAVAYIGSREDASARSVVWPSQHIYTSIYGDVSRLRLLLEGAGYSEGRLSGARVRRIMDGDNYVVPYIDAGGDLKDDGQFLIIGRGEISSESTTGLSRLSWYCPRCEDDTTAEDTVHFANGDSEEWCYSCCDHHTTWCDHNECLYSDDESFVTVHSNDRQRTVLEDDAEDFGAVYLDDRGEWWEQACCRKCDASGEWFHADDLTEYNGEWLSDGYLPEPLDDDDASQANAHILAYRKVQSEAAAALAHDAAEQVAREQAEAESPTPEHGEPADGCENPLPTMIPTPAVPVAAVSHAGV
jgi:hypothetical protein